MQKITTAVYFDEWEEVEFTMMVEIDYTPGQKGSRWVEPLAPMIEIVGAEIIGAEICGDRLDIAIDGSDEAISQLADEIIEENRESILESLYAESEDRSPL